VRVRVPPPASEAPPRRASFAAVECAHETAPDLRRSLRRPVSGFGVSQRPVQARMTLPLVTSCADLARWVGLALLVAGL